MNNDYIILLMAGLAIAGLWGISFIPNKGDKQKKLKYQRILKKQR